MDPKMDSGVENSGYCSIEEAIENGAAPIPLSLDRMVDVQRTIDVMDHLLACEVLSVVLYYKLFAGRCKILCFQHLLCWQATWHKGHSLAQTVFSCIYLLRIERTSSHSLLHSYCRITRATCNAIISAVADARTHEVCWCLIYFSFLFKV